MAKAESFDQRKDRLESILAPWKWDQSQFKPSYQQDELARFLTEEHEDKIDYFRDGLIEFFIKYRENFNVCEETDEPLLIAQSLEIINAFLDECGLESKKHEEFFYRSGLITGSIGLRLLLMAFDVYHWSLIIAKMDMDDDESRAFIEANKSLFESIHTGINKVLHRCLPNNLNDERFVTVLIKLIECAVSYRDEDEIEQSLTFLIKNLKTFDVNSFFKFHVIFYNILNVNVVNIIFKVLVNLNIRDKSLNINDDVLSQLSCLIFSSEKKLSKKECRCLQKIIAEKFDDKTKRSFIQLSIQAVCKNAKTFKPQYPLGALFVLQQHVKKYSEEFKIINEEIFRLLANDDEASAIDEMMTRLEKQNQDCEGDDANNSAFKMLCQLIDGIVERAPSLELRSHYSYLLVKHLNALLEDNTLTEVKAKLGISPQESIYDILPLEVDKKLIHFCLLFKGFYHSDAKTRQTWRELLKDYHSADTSRKTENELDDLSEQEEAFEQQLLAFYSKFDEKQKLAFLEALPADVLRNFFMSLQVKKQDRTLRSLFPLTSMSVMDGGQSDDDWWYHCDQLINKNSQHGIGTKIKKAVKTTSTTNNDANERQTLGSILGTLPLVDIIGRTLVFQRQDGTLHALKIQKKHEKVAELTKEYQTVRRLSKLKTTDDKSSLKSDIPVGISVSSDNSAEQLMTFVRSAQGEDITNEKKEKFFALVGDSFNTDDTVSIYQYQVPSADYFIYLHDPDLDFDSFKAAMEKSIDDLCYLLREKGVVFNQLADLFHNQQQHHQSRNDNGFYLALANMVLKRHRQNQVGNGRIEAWLKAVEFPNIRKSGIADLGDHIKLSELLDPAKNSNKFVYKDKNDPHYEADAKKVYYNQIAEYLLVLQLITGVRGRKLSLTMTDKVAKEKLWNNLAKVMLDITAKAIHHLANIPLDNAKAFLKQIVDVKAYGRQMQFWMTDDYIADVNSKSILENNPGLYPDLELINYGELRQGTYCFINGFCINPENGPDLGAVNGQEPIKEGNKLFYSAVSLIESVTASRADFRDQLLALNNDNKPAKPLTAQYPGPNKLIHHRAYSFFYGIQEKRASEHGDDEQQQKYQAWKEQHDREVAAISLQRRWRQRSSSGSSP